MICTHTHRDHTNDTDDDPPPFETNNNNDNNDDEEERKKKQKKTIKWDQKRYMNRIVLLVTIDGTNQVQYRLRPFDEDDMQMKYRKERIDKNTKKCM